MTVEESLEAELKNYAGLSALVGTRIDPLQVNGATLPAVTYVRVSGVRVQAMDGPTGLAVPVFQVSSWATTYAAAKAVAKQVRLCLDGFNGTLGGVGGVNAKITLQGDRDLVDTETNWRQVAADYEIAHQE
jgi:hypothetical protein